MTNTRRVKKTKTVATVAIGATRPNFQGPPQNATLASSLLFDMRDVLLFVVIVAIIASIVYGTGLLMGGKDVPMMVVVVPDKNKPPSQSTNNENIGAEIPVASIVFISLLLCFVAYLVATGKSSKVIRLAPSLGVASFFVGVGSFIRFYPSNWSHAASSGCVIVGYSLAVFLAIKEFSILPWDREKKKIDNEKNKWERGEVELLAALQEYRLENSIKGKITPDMDLNLMRKMQMQDAKEQAEKAP
jgi:hypothetical protein